VKYFVMKDGRITRPTIGSSPGVPSVEAAATVGAGAMLAFQDRVLVGGGECAARISDHMLGLDLPLEINHGTPRT
jgi:hypothetical protein